MDEEYVSMCKQKELVDCLKSDFHSYVPSLTSRIYLRKILRKDVEKVRCRTEQFLKDLNKVLEDWR